MALFIRPLPSQSPIILSAPSLFSILSIMSNHAPLRSSRASTRHSGSGVSLVSFPPLPPGTRTFNGPPHPSTERHGGPKFVVVALLNALARLNLGSMYTCQGSGTPHGLIVAFQNQHLRMYFWCVTCFFYQHFGGFHIPDDFHCPKHIVDDAGATSICTTSSGSVTDSSRWH